MPTTQTESHKNIIEMLAGLSEESLASAMDYIGYLRHLEEQEDEEDIACYLERKDEPTVPLGEILKDYEDKYGPLDPV